MEGQLLTRISKGCPYPVFVNEKDGSVLVEVPASEFMMGDGGDPECPEHRIFVGRFAIGVFAVTNCQYQHFVAETGHRPPIDAEWGYPVWRDGSYPAQLANHPVVCVSWDDAVQYCKWAEVALPTEAQWEKAARGPVGTSYSWGNSWDANRCLNYFYKGSEQTCPVYDFADGVSGYGVFNACGNVLEWCRDYYDENYYRVSPPENPAGPDTGEYRVARGGSWGGGPRECRCACRSEYNFPDERANFRGFRVARELQHQ